MINNVSFSQNYLSMHIEQKPQKSKKLIAYGDSFVKQSKKSIPMLLALTSVKTLLEYNPAKYDVKKLFALNMLRFFIPVLAASSLLLTGLEIHKPNKK